MRTSNVAVSLLAVIVTACSAGENPSTTASAANAAAVDEVRARMDAYPVAGKNADLAALADYWTADAVIMEPERQLTAAEQNKLAADVLATHNVTTFDLSARERSAHDGATVVYEFGRYAETLTPKDGKSAPLVIKGNYAARWIKSTDGTWKIHRFISVPPPPDSVKVEAAGAAVPPAAGAALDAAAASTRVTQAMNDFTARLNSGDAEGALKFLADDVQLYETELQLMSKAAFAQLMNEVLAANGVSIALTIDQVFTHDGGTIAYQFGHFEEKVTPKDARTPPSSYRNNLLTRWKRGPGGGWLLDRMIVTPMPKG